MKFPMPKLMSNRKKRVMIVGSTGSIGTQALEVISSENDRFEVVGLSAQRNETLLNKQAYDFGVKQIHLASNYELENREETLCRWIESVEADWILVAISGPGGLQPTLAALCSGKNIAMANKEALVMAGGKIMQEAESKNLKIIPVDSEHSAVFQCLQGIEKESIEKIILTCSGGPFWQKPREELENVTVKEALKHPIWSMGNKITIDSATWVNKGFEVIEAHHLFGVDYDQIEVRVHPQSLVHGIVQLKDGNVLMHAASPDMRIPLHYALNYPERRPLTISKGTTQKIHKKALLDQTLEFFSPEESPLEGIQMAYEVGRRGADASARFVLANEQAVHDFLGGKIKFLEIYERIRADFERASSERA